jgi:hypothetical protein
LSHLATTSEGKVVVNFSKASRCLFSILMAFTSCVSRLTPVMAVSIQSALINLTRTKVCDLAPVPSPRVIIDGVSSRA